MENPFDESVERPVTSCPDCANEVDLTFGDIGSTVTCTVCGAEWVVLSLDPPELETAD